MLPDLAPRIHMKCRGIALLSFSRTAIPHEVLPRQPEVLQRTLAGLVIRYLLEGCRSVDGSNLNLATSFIKSIFMTTTCGTPDAPKRRTAKCSEFNSPRHNHAYASFGNHGFNQFKWRWSLRPFYVLEFV